MKRSVAVIVSLVFLGQGSCGSKGGSRPDAMALDVGLDLPSTDVGADAADGRPLDAIPEVRDSSPASDVRADVSDSKPTDAVPEVRDGSPTDVAVDVPKDGLLDIAPRDGHVESHEDATLLTIESVWPATTTTSGAFFVIGSHLDGISRVEVGGVAAQVPAGGLSANHVLVVLPPGMHTGPSQVTLISSAGGTASVPVNVVSSVSGVPASPPNTIVPNPLGFDPEGVNNDWTNEYDQSDSRYFLKNDADAGGGFTFINDPNTSYVISGSYSTATRIVQFSMYLDDPNNKEEYAGVFSDSGQALCPRMILFPKTAGTELLLRPYSCGQDKALGDVCTASDVCRPDLTCSGQVCLGVGSLVVSLTFSADSEFLLHVILPDDADLSYYSQVEGGIVDGDPCQFSCDTSAPNVENALFLQAAPVGSYGVRVENVDGRGAGSFSVTVTSAGQQIATFSGSLPMVANALSQTFSFAVSH